MEAFRNLFNSFSRRTPEVAKSVTFEIPATTRIRVLRWCDELYRGERPSNIVGRGEHNPEFWAEIYRRLQYRTGRVALSVTDNGHDIREAANYVMSCSAAEFLDFLEDVFDNPVFFHVNSADKNIVDELNAILRQDNLPYTLTYFVHEDVEIQSGMFQGHRGTQTTSYPKVIVKGSEIVQQEAIAPVLQLLSQPHFKAADAEFLAALEDYRKGDIGDCLVKCGSALESVMKVICDRRKWPYRQTDTASSLVKIMIAHTSLDPFFESLLLGVATIRNRMSSAHGAGVTVKQPARHVAQYALNLTASAILLLVQEAGV